MPTSYLDLSPEQFRQLSELSIDTPLQMLNLLRFRDDLTEAGLTGAQQYDLYMKAALPFFKASQAKVLFYGKMQLSLIGPIDPQEWDKVLLVEYANKERFMQMVMHKEYPSHLRRLALADSRLMLCTSVHK